MMTQTSDRIVETFNGSSDGKQLILGDHRGVYIPREFVTDTYLLEQAQSEIIAQDIAILSDPDSDLYWEVWEAVKDNWIGIDADGNEWYLYQDGDLFAVCEALMDCETYRNFYGVDREDVDACKGCPECKPEEY